MRIACIAVAALLASDHAKAEIGAGKYFCFVAHMAGIQLNKNTGLTFSGNIEPREEKFFIDIHAAAHPQNLCGSSSDDWFLCKAKWELQIGDGHRLRTDSIVAGFANGFPFFEHFQLYDDGRFNSYQTDGFGLGLYVLDGKCMNVTG